MKISVAALAILLIPAFCSQASTQTNSAAMNLQIKTACCFTFSSRQLPRIFVAEYYVTDSMCSLPGIVFITKKGREICANPKDAWVKKYVNSLKLSRSGDGLQ